MTLILVDLVDMEAREAMASEVRKTLGDAYEIITARSTPDFQMSFRKRQDETKK